MDAQEKIDNVKNSRTYANSISEIENIECIILTSLGRGIMINDIIYFSYHEHEWIGGYVNF